jgi:serine/threonine protein kinase
MQHPFHLMPDMMVGPFRIQARLGAGGFGAVFRAECGGELYAVKFAVHGPGSQDLNLTDERAQRELECLLLTHHPNVVRVWAHGRWPHPRTGYHFIVMDYVEGPTLLEWARRAHPTLRQVVELFSTLALTLDALHAQGLHHRDLKGSNILVRHRDGEPVLVDFGAGEHTTLAVPLTEGPLPPGTPHLRTPEALRFHREQYADPLARYAFRPSDDLYALGCTLYEVLTGAPPFPPTLPRELLVSLIEKELPPSPAVLNAQVPPALAGLVLQLLAKLPEQRPASGQVLHEQLQALLQEGLPAWDRPLQPGAESATTEGAGPAVPPGAARLDSEASGSLALTVQEAAPVLERPGQKRARWVAGGAALVLLVGLGVALRCEAPSPPPPVFHAALPTDSPAEPEAPLPPELQPPFSLMTSASSDAGPLAEAEAPSSLPQTKGQSMKLPTKSSEDSRQPEGPRGSGGSKKGPRLAGAVIVACTMVDGGCASTPHVPPGPPPELACPPAAANTLTKTFRLKNADMEEITMPGADPDMNYGDLVVVTAGRHEVKTTGDGFWHVPPQTVMVGDFVISDRVYARFTELRIGDKTYPWCAYLVSDEVPLPVGAAIKAEAGSGAVKVRAFARARVTTFRF